MKKVIAFLLVMSLILPDVVAVYAGHIPGGSSSDEPEIIPVSDPDVPPSSESSSETESKSEPSTKGTEGTESPRHEDPTHHISGTIPADTSHGGGSTYARYWPRVAYLENINYLAAIDGQGNNNDPSKLEGTGADDVYWIPSTKDVTFDLEKYFLNNGITDKGSEKFKYAIVDTGEFDQEAELYQQTKKEDENIQNVADAVADTVSKITTDNQAYPALKLLGYDLLLSKDAYTVNEVPNGIDFEHSIKRTVGALTTEVAAMDIYKALRAYEYKVSYASTKPTEDQFNISKSAIYQKLANLNIPKGSENDMGVDISEGLIGCAISRTDPDLYWKRITSDGVLMAPIINAEESDFKVSKLTRTGAIAGRKGKLTYSEFCRLLVCLMNLYGEVPLSADNMTKARQAYANEFAAIDSLDDTDREIAQYLIAKGILDPKLVFTIKWNDYVYLLPKNGDTITNYIIDILYRVAKPEARYPIPEIPESIPADLAEDGYGSVNINATDVYDYTQISTAESTNCFDVFIEVVPSNSTRTSNLSEASYLNSSLNPEAGSGDFVGAANMKFYQELVEPTTSVKGTWDLVKAADPIAPNPNPLFYLEEYSAEKDAMNYHYYGIEYHLGKGDETIPYYHFKVSKKFAETHKDKLLMIANDFDETESATFKRKGKSAVVTNSADADIKITKMNVCYCNIGTGGVCFQKDSTSREFTDVRSFDEMLYSYDYTDADRISGKVRFTSDKTHSFSFRKTSIKTLSDFQTYFNKKISGNPNKQTRGAYALAHGFNYDQITSNGANGNLPFDKVIDIFDAANITDDSDAAGITKPTFCKLFISRGNNANQNSNGSESSYLFEVQTDGPDWFLKFSGLILSGAKESVTGYYRLQADGKQASLMVDVDELKENGLIQGLDEIAQGIYVVTLNASNGHIKGNVVINTNLNFICVGDTMYPNLDDEVLVQNGMNGVKYINYRCVTGWAGDFGLVSNMGKGAFVTLPGDYLNRGSHVSNSLKTVQPAFDSSPALKTMFSLLTFKRNRTVSGFNMTGTYALAPYLIVMNKKKATQTTSIPSGMDVLFVWHRKKIRTRDKINCKISRKADKNARKVFKEMTGMKLDKQKDYSLVYYVLDRKNKQQQDQCGMVFASQKNSNKAGTFTASYGYLYTPTVYDKLSVALNDYAKTAYVYGSKADWLDKTNKNHSAKKYPSKPSLLPIIQLSSNNNYYDVNVNVCSSNNGSTVKKLGVLPYYIYSSNQADQKHTTTITDDANGQIGLSASEKTHSTADWSILTAPVGMFSQLKNMGTMKAIDCQSTMYYGGNLVKVMNNKITINGVETTLPVDQNAYCSYLSNGQDSVYCVSGGATKLGNFIDALETKAEFLLDDVSSLVDWDKYRFHTLVRNADKWTSVALIFILNIFPRVCTLLCFLLMMLCLIANVKPWQLFCHKFFDPYKLLTFGHQSVDTVNLKRMFTISLTCSILFWIIMDGQLINFIIWVAKAFIYWQQH